MELTYFLLVVFLILILTYLYIDRKFNHWARKGVPHLPSSSIFFGNILDVLKGKDNCATFYNKLYRLFPEIPFCGYFEFQNPVILLRDPQVIQTVLVEKFNCFHDNKFRVKERNDLILGKNPAILPGKRWKETRSTFVAAMTPSKIKILEEIVKVVSQDMFKFIDKNNSKGGIEAHDLATRFMSETVANYSWGIRSEGFSDESTVKEKFDTARNQDPKPMALVLFHPFLADLLRIRLFPKELEEFMLNVTDQVFKKVGQTLNKTSIIHYIVNAKEKSGQGVTLQELVGHVGTVFLDGYDTSSRVLSNTIFTLMLHPDVQQRVREEIMEIKDDFTIDNVNKVEYLEMIILEILRLYPPVPVLGRKCTESCTLGSLLVDVGTEFIIPVYALGHDPKYFPNPEVFNPENFSEENKSKRHKFAFLPFGQGPRMCAGMRFALAEIKLILCNILKNYEIVPPLGKEVKPITIELSSPFFVMPEHSPFVQLKKLNIT